VSQTPEGIRTLSDMTVTPSRLLDLAAIEADLPSGDPTQPMTFQHATAGHHVRPLLAEVKLLRELVKDLADVSEPCDYDHHGYCQTHSLDERPCPHERAAALLATAAEAGAR
jgi:hypothetical protein